MPHGSGLSPEIAFALIGLLGVGSQWLAWRLQLPAIVLMLATGLLIGPVTGVMVPARDIGPLVSPLISIAVAVILFEGGLTLRLGGLSDAAAGVRRLVLIGAPLGWLLSALSLHFIAGLGWESSAVFGGIMIVTGPTVIAPLLRQARLARRPAVMLQWEAIVNDPIGALAALAAFKLAEVWHNDLQLSESLLLMLVRVTLAAIIGWAAGKAIVLAFRRALVPEYMKVPVLFVAVLAAFVLAETITHETGLLTVTLMGLVIANSDLPSFVELRRFKEQATILLVSGVFILLAAGMDLKTLAALDWHAAAFIVVVILVARPLSVLAALAGSGLPRNERLLIAFTGPRGVVLVAVAGLFAERLVRVGIEDGARLVPLAFALVVATVVLHGFTLAPLARALGLAGHEAPGLMIAGGSRFATALGVALKAAGIPVLVTDRNYTRLRSAREAGLANYYGDILSESAEHGVEMVSFGLLLAATENDAYNTLVATDLAPEFGRENVFQLKRAGEQSRRHALPASLGGQAVGQGEGFFDLDRKMAEGWEVKVTPISEEFPVAEWRRTHPEAVVLGTIGSAGLRLRTDEAEPKVGPGAKIVAMVPPEAAGPHHGGADIRGAG
ncbi:sodium:proton antiporter [Tropicimonas sp. IMCC34043]|uniref:cation:proton antiporter n=1 Tax=Tropicimonas sp. IMCC34043 TaxID=2248760 RepID=UPI000E28300D|nr:sodium:proton antiporter [Tropicimonas sp. IMCC34043]